MDFSHLLKKRLFSPGPTEIPLRSQFAAVDNNPYHRTQAFYSIIMNCLEFLKGFFGTETMPVILTASGTGAMEAALVNLTNPGTRVLMISGGRFGDRWIKMAQAYACETTVVAVPWGQSLSPDELLQQLKKNSGIQAVFFQAVETSTGAYFPVAELARTVRQNSDALVIVDALSSLLCHEMNMDAWGIDCVFAASQKGFGAGAGLSFIALSERARSRLSVRPRFYFNLVEEMQAQSTGKTAWTPGTQSILTLQASLKALSAIGREELYKFHRQMAYAVRAALAAMGIEPFVKDQYAFSVTPFKVPSDIAGEKLKATLQEKYSVTFAGGQDHLKGKVLRLAHLGFVDPFDLLAAIAALELSLKGHGYTKALGLGTNAMMQNFPMWGEK